MFQRHVCVDRGIICPEESISKGQSLFNVKKILKVVFLGFAVGMAGWLSSFLIYQVLVIIFDKSIMDGFSGYHRQITASLVLLSLIFAPLFESLLIFYIVKLLIERNLLNSMARIVVPSLFMMIYHGATIGSLVILPTFLLHAYVSSRYISKKDYISGVSIIWIGHFTQNLISIIRPLIF
jgi:hypothetical protein